MRFIVLDARANSHRLDFQALNLAERLQLSIRFGDQTVEEFNRFGRHVRLGFQAHQLHAVEKISHDVLNCHHGGAECNELLPFDFAPVELTLIHETDNQNGTDCAAKRVVPYLFVAKKGAGEEKAGHSDDGARKVYAPRDPAAFGHTASCPGGVWHT